MRHSVMTTPHRRHVNGGGSRTKPKHPPHTTSHTTHHTPHNFASRTCTKYGVGTIGAGRPNEHGAGGEGRACPATALKPPDGVVADACTQDVHVAVPVQTRHRGARRTSCECRELNLHYSRTTTYRSTSITNRPSGFDTVLEITLLVHDGVLPPLLDHLTVGTTTGHR